MQPISQFSSFVRDSEPNRPKMMFKAIFLLVAVAAAAAQLPPPPGAMNLSQCPGGHRMPHWFVSPHCTVDLCTLTRTHVFTGRAHVTPHRQFERLDVIVEATALGLPIDMPIPEGYESACDFLEGGHRCPVTQGGEYVWALQFPIANFLPSINVVIRRKFTLVLNLLSIMWYYFTVSAGDGAERVACAQVNGRIVAP